MTVLLELFPQTHNAENQKKIIDAIIKRTPYEGMAVSKGIELFQYTDHLVPEARSQLKESSYQLFYYYVTKGEVAEASLASMAQVMGISEADLESTAKILREIELREGNTYHPLTSTYDAYFSQALELARIPQSAEFVRELLAHGTRFYGSDCYKVTKAIPEQEKIVRELAEVAELIPDFQYRLPEKFGNRFDSPYQQAAREIDLVTVFSSMGEKASSGAALIESGLVGVLYERFSGGKIGEESQLAEFADEVSLLIQSVYKQGGTSDDVKVPGW